MACARVMDSPFRNAIRSILATALAIAVVLGCGNGGSGGFAPQVQEPPSVAGTPSGLALALSIASDIQGEIGSPASSGGTEFRAALDALAANGSAGAFMISPGDVFPPGSTRAAIDEGLGTGFPWFPVVGNHDAERSSSMDYLRSYSLPMGAAAILRYSRGPKGAVNTMYSFDAGSGSTSAHFAILNEYYDGGADAGAPAGRISASAYAWLSADLKRASSLSPSPDYIFVFGHEPIYPLPDEATGRVRHRGDSLDAYPDEARDLIALLESYAASAYICGHSHDFSAALLDGVLQIEDGRAAGTADAGAPSTVLRVELYGNMAVVTALRSTDGIDYSATRILRIAPRAR